MNAPECREKEREKKREKREEREKEEKREREKLGFLLGEKWLLFSLL